MMHNHNKRKRKLISKSNLPIKRRKLNSTSYPLINITKNLNKLNNSQIETNNNEYCIICPKYCNNCCIKTTTSTEIKYKTKIINNQECEIEDVYTTRKCIWCNNDNNKPNDVLMYCICCETCKICMSCHNKIRKTLLKLTKSKYEYAQYFIHFLLFLQINEYYSSYQLTECKSDLDLFFEHIKQIFIKLTNYCNYQILSETYYITSHYNVLIKNGIINKNDHTKLKIESINYDKFIAIIDTTIGEHGHINILIVDEINKKGIWINPNASTTTDIRIQSTQMNKHFILDSKENIFLGLNHKTHYTHTTDQPEGGMCKEIGYCNYYIILDTLFDNPSISIDELSKILNSIKNEFGEIMKIHPIKKGDVWDLWAHKNNFINKINNL